MSWFIEQMLESTLFANCSKDSDSLNIEQLLRCCRLQDTHTFCS